MRVCVRLRASVCVCVGMCLSEMVCWYLFNGYKICIAGLFGAHVSTLVCKFMQGTCELRRPIAMYMCCHEGGYSTINKTFPRRTLAGRGGMEFRSMPRTRAQTNTTESKHSPSTLGSERANPEKAKENGGRQTRNKTRTRTGPNQA